MPEPVLSPAARRAEQKRKAAERARNYREKVKQEGLPTARDVDAALAEAVSFLRRYALIVDGRPKLDLGDLMFVAGLILKRGGKRKKPALEAIGGRMALRDEHRQSHWMPSMKPKQPDLLLPPGNGRTWTDQDVRQLQDAIDRHFVNRTSSLPCSESTPVTPSNAVTRPE